MFDIYTSGRPEKTRRPSLPQIIAVAVTAVIHAAVLYGLYHGKITVRIFPFGSEVQEVVIAPSPNLAYPVIMGSSSPGTAASRPDRAGPGAAPGETQPDRPSGREILPPPLPYPAPPSAPIRALSAKFYEALTERNRTPSKSGLKITFAPPAAEERGAVADLSAHLYPGLPTSRGSAAGSGGAGGTGGRGRQRASLSIPLEGYDLTPWAEKVIAIIQRNWDLPAVRNLPPRTLVRIVVVVGKSGLLSSFELLTSSSLAVLDQAAVRAIRTSLPFPPLPDDFPADLLEAFFEFSYND